MKDHTHPGKMVKRITEQRNVDNEQMALMLGIRIEYFDLIIKCLVDVNIELAFRLSHVLGLTPQRWMYMQVDHNISKYDSRGLFK